MKATILNSGIVLTNSKGETEALNNLDELLNVIREEANREIGRIIRNTSYKNYDIKIEIEIKKDLAVTDRLE